MRSLGAGFFIQVIGFLIIVSNAQANSACSDLAGVSVRLGSVLLPIPTGFVIESVNVRVVDDNEFEELRFINTKDVSRLRAIDVRRRRSLFEADDVNWDKLQDFGENASIRECEFGQYKIYAAEYFGFPESTKAAIIDNDFQVILIGEDSPQYLIRILKTMEGPAVSGGQKKSLDELMVCFLGS